MYIYEPMLFNACIVMIPLFNELGGAANRISSPCILLKKTQSHTLFECQCIRKVLIGDTMFTSLTGDRNTVLCGHLSHRKVLLFAVQGVPSLLSYLKTLSIGPALGIEPMTSCSEIKSSTY